MNLLLCTHSFIWWTTARKKLSVRAFAEISNSANRVFLSVASLWELQIKIQINKFKFTGSLEIVVNEQIKTTGFQLLPVNFVALKLVLLAKRFNDSRWKICCRNGNIHCRKFDAPGTFLKKI